MADFYRQSGRIFPCRWQDANGICNWLRAYPTLSAAQVCDWLKEHYNEDFRERTVSRYVKRLREEYGLKKAPNPRDYEAVPELPMGQ